MDSTACLVGSDAPHVDLSFHFLPVGQRDMEEDNPITRHLKLQRSFVTASFCLFRLCNPRTHICVRHASLNRTIRPVTGLPLASDNLRIIVVERTRIGLREISCSIATKAEDATGRKQLVWSKFAAQTTPASHLVTLFPEEIRHFLIRQLLLSRGGPTRRYRPGSRARPRVETCGNTYR
jgi:hypothetical protein